MLKTALGESAARNHALDMTDGSPPFLILRFGLPLIAATTLQQLYAMVDTIILGRFGGVTGLAVLGTAGWPVWLSVSILTNFAQAACILLAKRFGAGDARGFKQAAGNIYLAAGALCALMTVAFQLAARPVLVWQNTPAEVIEQAVAYLRISYGGIIALLAYNIYAAFLRAVGDSKTPLYAIGAATVVNALLDVWFVAGLGWGAPGAAAATVIAQAVSAVVCMARVRQHEVFRLERSHFRPIKSILKEYTALGVPMVLQSLVIAMGGFFVQNRVNAYGTAFMAGMSATVKVFGLLETAAIALAQSAATFVSQNWGAGQFTRIREGVRVSVCISLGIAALLMASMFLSGRQILSLFVSEEAVSTSWELLLVMSSGLLIMYPMYVLRQSIQALGNAMVPLAAAVIQLLVRILTSLYLPMLIGRAGLYFPTVAAWLTSLILIGLTYPAQLRRCRESADSLSGT